MIDLGENIIDSSCYYVRADGSVHILSVETLADFVRFSDIFGARLTPMQPEYAKQLFSGVAVDYETRGAGYVDVQYRTSLDNVNYGAWKSISEAQFTGRYVEIAILPRSVDGIGTVGVRSVSVTIDVPDIEEIIEKVTLKPVRTRIRYKRKFAEVRSVALYTQDENGQQAISNIVEQTNAYIDMCILDAEGNMISGLLQKAVIRGY